MMVGQGIWGQGMGRRNENSNQPEFLLQIFFRFIKNVPHPHPTRLVIAFYYYNLIGGNYDTFGNTVTPVSAIDGRRE